MHTSNTPTQINGLDIKHVMGWVNEVSEQQIKKRTLDMHELGETEEGEGRKQRLYYGINRREK